MKRLLLQVANFAPFEDLCTTVKTIIMILSHVHDKHVHARGYPIRPHTFVSPSTDSRRAVVSYWQKHVHKVLVNRLGGLIKPAQEKCG